MERDYVECQCLLVGDYAVAIPPSYGWTLPGPISCGFVVVCISYDSMHSSLYVHVKIVRRLFSSCALFFIFSLFFIVGNDTGNSSSYYLLQKDTARHTHTDIPVRLCCSLPSNKVFKTVFLHFSLTGHSFTRLIIHCVFVGDIID